MVRLPQYDGQRDSLNVGTEFFRPGSDSSRGLAQAAENLGGAVNSLAATYVARQERIGNFTAEKELLDLSERTNRYIEKAAENIPENGLGFHASTLEVVQKDAAAVLDRIPENLRAEYDIKIRGFLNDTSDRLAKAEIAQGKTFLKTVTERKLSQITDNVTNGVWDKTRATAELDAFVGGSGVPENMAAYLKHEGMRTIEASQLQHQLSTDPYGVFRDLEKYQMNAASDKAGPLQQLAVERAKAAGEDPELVLTILQIESGWNPNATASKTIAGLAQISASERRRLGIPEDMRFDPGANLYALTTIIRENRERLQANGVEINPTTIYASHLLGQSGAIKFWTADPNADAFETYAAVAGRGVATQAFDGSNGKLLQKGMTVGQVRDALDKFVGDGRQKVQPYLRSEAALDQSGPIDVAGKRYDVLGVADMGVAYGKARDYVQKVEQDRAVALSKTVMIDGGVFNAYDPAHRKSMDDAATADQAGTKILTGDKETTAKYLQRAEQGYLPKPAAQAAMKFVNDPKGGYANKTTGYDLLAASYRSNPVDGLQQSGVDADTVKRVRDYVNLQLHGGFDKPEAIRRVELMNSPEFKIKEKDLQASVEKAVRKRSFSEIDKALKLTTGALWWKDSSAPDQKVIRDRFEAKYQSYFRFHYLNANGDVEVAKANAIADLQKAHNFTRLDGGTPRMTPYPPEYAYPAATPTTKPVSEMTADEVKAQFGYIKTQAAAQVRVNLMSAVRATKDAKAIAAAEKAVNDINEGNVRLVPNAQTVSDIEAGVTPRYTVMYRDRSGAFIPGAYEFRADPSFTGSGPRYEGDVPLPAPSTQDQNRRDAFRAKRGN